MDTQGTEIDVLDGARGCLDRIKALQAEVSFLPLYKEIPPYHQVIEHAKTLGFQVTGLFPVGRDIELRLVDADCVMRRIAA
jgi:hypothetical protein